MRKKREEIEISLTKSDVKLFIYEEKPGSLFELDETEAAQIGESRWQLIESCSYSFSFSNDRFRIREIPGIAINSKNEKVKSGRINTDIYSGTLILEVYDLYNIETTAETVELEILSTKLDPLTGELNLDEGYRTSYRTMMEDIAAKSTDLLLQINSPVNQSLQPDFEKENRTIYQRFSFVKSLISSDDFNDAVLRILHSPAARWKEEPETTDIRRVRRFTNSTVRQIITGSNRIGYKLTEEIFSVPGKVFSPRKAETYDIPENRFIKYALELFAAFCESCEKKFQELEYKKAEQEAASMVKALRNYLEASLFREVSRPLSLNLNSPLLQRKGGYREVLNAWMLYYLAAKLIWQGGDKVFGQDKIYKAEKRDLAILYEYWLFFQLYDLFIGKFEITEISHNGKSIKSIIDDEKIVLTEDTKDGLGLKLKSGLDTSVTGKTRNETRGLNVRFSYNRTYSGDTSYLNKDGDFWQAKDGSWTKPMRPDFTFSIWPGTLKEEDAEREDIIVHIHFDAKYKVRRFDIPTSVTRSESEPDGSEDSLEKEKTESRKGIYRNADLLKMHAYKDAIRRTSGAYILYPGEGDPDIINRQFSGFHEIIPGLGAFAIRPSNDNSKTGMSEISGFIDKVIFHFQDRANQRERISSKDSEIHKVKKPGYKDDGITPNIISEDMPEYLDPARKLRLIPDETYVLIGYYHGDNHLNWIKSKHKYNIRYGSRYPIKPDLANTKYLLLHSDTQVEPGLFRITSEGPRVFTNAELIDKLSYPSDPSQDLYLVFSLSEETSFTDIKWDLSKFPKGAQKRKPFALTLSEVLEKKEK